MSGSLAALLAQPQGINPVDRMTQLAQLGQTQAQTGLIQQQAVGANIGNQLANLNLGRQGYIYDAAGIPHAPLPGQPGSAVGGAQQGGGGAPGGGSSYPGEVGMRLYGVPLPPIVALGTNGEPEKIKAAQETRRQTLYSTLNVPDDQLPGAVRSMFTAGYLDPQTAGALLAHPGMHPRFLAAMATPEAYQAALTAAHGQGVQLDQNGNPAVSPTMAAASGARASETAAGTVRGELAGGAPQLAGMKTAATTEAASRFETTTIMVPDPDRPGQLRSETVQKSQVPAFMGANAGARPANAADLTNAQVTLSPGSYADRVVRSENMGGAPGAKSATSNATGDGQFMPATWAATVAAAKPAWAAGMTPAQIQAARAVPQYAREMSYALAQQNAPQLEAAGLPVNSMSLGLAHQFGAGGAANVLKADPEAPMEKLVTRDVLDANAWLKGKTAGDVLGRAFKSYGVNQVTLDKPFGAPTPSGPGAIPGQTVLTPQGTAGLGAATTRLGADQEAVAKSQEAAGQAQVQQQNLVQFRDLAAGLRTGAGGESRQAMQNFVQTYAPEFMGKLTKSLSAGLIDPAEAGQWQAMAKQALLTYGNMEKANNPQGGLGITQMYASAFPNWETQPTAVRDMSNLMLVSQQRTIDQAAARQEHLNTQLPAAQQDPRSYRPLQAADAAFMAAHPPRVYVGAAAALNGKPVTDWGRGMTREQQAEAYRVAWRSDPSANLLMPNGEIHPNPALKNGG